MDDRILFLQRYQDNGDTRIQNFCVVDLTTINLYIHKYFIASKWIDEVYVWHVTFDDYQTENSRVFFGYKLLTIIVHVFSKKVKSTCSIVPSYVSIFVARVNPKMRLFFWITNDTGRTQSSVVFIHLYHPSYVRAKV